MDLYAQAVERFPVFMLIAMRTGAILFVSPVFGARFVPAQWKVVFTILLSLLILPLVASPAGGTPGDLLPWAAAAVKELAVGLLLGFIANLVLAAVQAAGELLDINLGFGIANILDPQSGQTVPLMGNFHQVLAMLVFLTVNAHHVFLSALVTSFQVVPLGAAQAEPGLRDAVLQMFAGLFVTALKLAAPVLGALFITDFALGIISRAVPQMNLFAVGLPVKLLIGLLVLAASMPVFVALTDQAWGDALRQWGGAMRLLGGH